MPEEVVITSKDIIMALSRGQNRISIRSLECSSSGANTLSNGITKYQFIFFVVYCVLFNFVCYFIVGFKIFFGDAAIAKN